MADKTFIGKLTTKEWPDGNITVKLTLNEADRDLMNSKHLAYTTIEIQKSKKGNWYACLSDFVPSSQPRQTQPVNTDNDDLPF
jgi:hypothetical protein